MGFLFFFLFLSLSLPFSVSVSYPLSNPKTPRSTCKKGFQDKYDIISSRFSGPEDNTNLNMSKYNTKYSTRFNTKIKIKYLKSTKFNTKSKTPMAFQSISLLPSTEISPRIGKSLNFKKSMTINTNTKKNKEQQYPYNFLLLQGSQNSLSFLVDNNGKNKNNYNSNNNSLCKYNEIENFNINGNRYRNRILYGARREYTNINENRMKGAPQTICKQINTLVKVGKVIFPRKTTGLSLHALSDTGKDDGLFNEETTTGMSISSSNATKIEIGNYEKSSPKVVETKIIAKDSFLRVLWDFSRPHTFIGTALCIPALHLFAVPGSTLFSLHTLRSIFYALLPSGLINIYITGLNQITDVDIDKINKPYLPIAANRLSKRNAIFVVLSCLFLALGFVYGPLSSSVYITNALQGTIILSTILGTIYSLPPFRLKRFPLLAAFCILAVRGSIVNIGFYLHALVTTIAANTAQSSIGINELFVSPTTSTTISTAASLTTRSLPDLSTSTVSSALAANLFNPISILKLIIRDPKCRYVSFFYAVFGTVIALMKDVPDIKGDLQNNVRSYSVRKGASRIFKMANNLMASLFFLTSGGLMISTIGAFIQKISIGWINGNILFLLLPISFSCLPRFVVAVLSLYAATEVTLRGAKVDPENGKEVYDHYMFLWKLFYGSYLALPFLV